MPSPLPEISSETSSEISNSISHSINNNEFKTDRLTDEDTNSELMVEYNELIERLQLDYLNDIIYKDGVTHALKLLFLDIGNKKRIKIGENIIPSRMVRKDLRQLNSFMIEHAISKFKEASRETEIRNPVAYLKSCIYNSIYEMELDIQKSLRYNRII